VIGCPGRRPWKSAVVSFGVALVLLGCPTPMGGWDLARLLREEPGLAGFETTGLGDLVPYPAPGADGIRLVACRWPARTPITVRLHLEGERMEWARRALTSLSRGLASVDFEIVAMPLDRDPKASPTVGIDVIEIGSVVDGGPVGVGDTLVSCHVAKSGAEEFGTLTRAEIRMRARVVDQLDELVPILPEEWTGALMHEIGHALGFQGHPRGGGSVLALDQDRLRRAGRLALAGDDWRDELLEAFYRLEVGRLLGWRASSEQTQRWFEAIEARLGAGGSGPLARVGDRHGDLEWKTQEGVVLRVRFLYWSRQLRSGGTLVALPTPDTRMSIAAERSTRNP
jgi:hypothetical protein